MTVTQTAGPASLVDLFARTVARHPDEPAVSEGDRQLTYAELAAEVAEVAALLRRYGVGAEDRVALYLPRSLDTIVALLAVLHVGGAYVPVDAAYPDARRDAMLTDARSRLVITAPGWGVRLQHLDRPVLELLPVVAGSTGVDRPPAAPRPAPSSAQAACVLFTSGSTGRPKGVVLEHRQMVAFALDPAVPELGPGHRTAQAASISFDTLTFELWRSFAGGAEVVVIPSIPELIRTDLQRQLRRHRITAMLAPAIALNHLARHDREALRSLRLLCSGGDVLLADTCRQLRAGGFAGAFFNLYGPTETTVACTGHEIDAPVEGDRHVPIGTAFAAARLYVLDEQLRPVPDGEPGQLFVGGAGVGRGYLDQPGLTARRFLPDPWGGGTRMYATGDRVRRAPDGALEYLGRLDSQVKIHGHRVEPEEVERALYRSGLVLEAAVQAVGPSGDKRLVAFVVPRAELRIPELRRWLAGEVAEQAVPAEFAVLDAMPLDAHGKRDWAQLAEVLADRRRRRQPYAPPDTATERYLVGLWEELLSMEHVGVQDDFFALGGHSLLAVRTRMRIERDLAVRLEPEATFEHSVVADLATYIDRSAARLGAPA
ncbi:amino acid adenylation domain-containing protein [Micromonospora sp. NPDC048868]|uniref:non-ribosomal peptide synthetase n=1 Tax=Micromonospora sp. NPDC048868 TaxID=3364258 RepID=UPI0037218A74